MSVGGVVAVGEVMVGVGAIGLITRTTHPIITTADPTGMAIVTAGDDLIGVIVGIAIGDAGNEPDVTFAGTF